MSNVKISALPAATTPLTGTELVPLVQSGVTSQVAVSNIKTALAGTNKQVQFNNSSAFGASASLTWDGTSLTATKLAGAHNGTVGATTPSTGAFTTLSATGTSTLVAINASGKITGTANVWSEGAGSDTAAVGNLFMLSNGAGGGSARYWATQQSSSGAAKVDYYFNGTSWAQIISVSSTGLAVTGTGSFTGNVGIGTTSPSAKLTIVSAATPVLSTFTSTLGGYDSYSTDDASGARFFTCFNSGGSVIGSISRVTTTNAVTFNTTSDYRLKTIVGAVTGQGERIDALKPIDYQWTEGGQNARGFLAHEFQEVYAGSVSGTKDAVDADGKPVYQAMQAATSEVIADLVAELQSLRKRITALEAK